MISLGYNGPEINPLSREEGVELTLALGAAYKGNDYDNADTYGRVLHFGGVNYLESQRDRDPEAFAAVVDRQVEALEQIVAPYVGRLASAKHINIAVKSELGWDLWERLFDLYSKTMHIEGLITGAAGVIIDRHMHFQDTHPKRVSEASETSWKGGDFRIGVVFDTTHMGAAFNYGVEAPDSDRMLVPVLGFPINDESFSGLWSWQISGRDKKSRLVEASKLGAISNPN